MDCVLRRARPLLGTLVSVQLVAEGADDKRELAAIDAAFAVMQEIHHAMSAHSADSDLAQLANAQRGAAVVLNPHTCAVLRAAQHWASESARAFDPARAGHLLSTRGARPGIAGNANARGMLSALQFTADSMVIVDGPLILDLGGIAKGYAVDQAIETLRVHGVKSALVNAGGDLRAMGDRTWPVDIRHHSSAPIATRLTRLKEGAIATSTRGADFVATRRTAGRWQCASVHARDCMTADALTKWALQSPEPGLRLRRTLREHGARLVRW
jgi:thiamine biosynthesis lipoprotein